MNLHLDMQCRRLISQVERDVNSCRAYAADRTYQIYSLLSSLLNHLLSTEGLP